MGPRVQGEGRYVWTRGRAEGPHGYQPDVMARGATVTQQEEDKSQGRGPRENIFWHLMWLLAHGRCSGNVCGVKSPMGMAN